MIENTKRTGMFILCFALLAAALVLSFASCKAASDDTDAVSGPPTGLSYPSLTVNTVVGVPFAAMTPTVGGGAVASYSVSPALPAGLNLDGKTGVISGTPTAATDPVLHTVTADNSAGSATFQLYSKVYSTAGATITGTVTLPGGGDEPGFIR